MNAILNEPSFYKQYIEHKGSIGHILHYLEVLGGLKHAENTTIGDNRCILWGKTLATFEFDSDGEPVFEFTRDYAWLNKEQDYWRNKDV